MTPPLTKLEHLIDQAAGLPPLRVAVVDAAQSVVLETLRDAHGRGFIEPRLIGDRHAIEGLCNDLGWTPEPDWIVPASSDAEAAATAVGLVRTGRAELIMKGEIHTDALMHALLDKDHGLRLPGQRVSHLFVAEVPTYPKLLGITDAAINIAPDLNAKAEILQNAIAVFHLLGIETPKVALLSAVETINPAIISTVDAACLTLMARRGQITGALVDGPLALDNAISRRAADEKRIVSQVAGDADILLVPELVSGNILAKELEYLAGAIAAGIALGLAAPVVLSSRADPLPARLASLALAVLLHHWTPDARPKASPPDVSLQSAPQPEHACCPLPA